jgi:hypothetical protein
MRRFVTYTVALALFVLAALPAAGAVEVMLMKRVFQVRSSPPSILASGTTFLVAAPASGSWAGHEHQWATWNGLSWTFEQPAEGNFTFVDAGFAGVTFPGLVYVHSDEHGPELVAGQAMGRMPVGVISTDTILDANRLKLPWQHFMVVGSLTITLEVAAAVELGTVVMLTQKAPGTSTVEVVAGEEISGAPSKIIGPWQTLRAQVLPNEHFLPEWVVWCELGCATNSEEPVDSDGR